MIFYSKTLALAIKMTFTTFNAVSIITDRFNNHFDPIICIKKMTTLCYIPVIFNICVHLANLGRSFFFIKFLNIDKILSVGRFRVDMRTMVKPWPCQSVRRTLTMPWA